MSTRYSQEEDQLLRDHFGKIPYAQLERLFVHRNRDSLRHRATKIGLDNPGMSAMVSLGKQRYTHNDHFFDKPTRLSSYWAGFIAADGCLPFGTKHFNLYLSTHDLAHLERFSRDICFSGPITFRPHRANGMCRLALWNAPGIRVALEHNYNVTPRKSLTLVPPDGLSNENQLAFAAGYIDGDGSIKLTTQGYLRTYIIGTQPVLAWMMHLFSQFTVELDAISRYPRATVKPSRHMHNFTYTITGRRALAIMRPLKASCEGLPLLLRKWHII